MAHELICWRCGASLASVSLPLRRLEECPACRAELHVCRMCQFYDRRIAKQCRQEEPEEVKDKERANFCDYFRPRPGAYDLEQIAADKRAKDQLASLFGSAPGAAPAPDGRTPPARDDALKAADTLFTGPARKK
jgi:hypothetical protein